VPGLGISLNGWNIETRASWCEPFSLDCSFVLFHSGRKLVVALARPKVISSKGGIESETITKEFFVTMKPGEVLANCGSYNDRPPVVGLLDKTRRRTRIYTTDGKSLSVFTSRYKAEPPCDLGSD
jgi:hypothetical protein